MLVSLLALSLLSLALAAPAPTTPGHVTSIKAQSHRLSVEAANALKKQRAGISPAMKLLLEDKDPVIHDATGQTTVNLADFVQYALIGNISVGTPAQNFSVMFNMWSSDMALVDVNAAFDTEYCDSDSGCGDANDALALKNPYNASASSTAVTSKKKFRGSYEDGDKGTITKDTVNINGLSLTMSFGDLTQVGLYMDFLPIDGIMGVSAVKSNNKISNVLNQLVGSLTSPVMTMHVNRSITDGDDWPTTTDAEIMFGSNALTQCNASGWQTLKMAKPQYGLSSANATSISITSPGVDGPCNNAVPQTSHPLVVMDSFMMTRVSVQAMEVFKKASGAVYNTDFGWYTVDCTQIGSLPSVSIGLADGNTVVVADKDYTIDLTSIYGDGACFLYVRGAYDEGDLSNQAYPILLNQVWLNNHCISYDINANTLAITNALPNNGN